jgi:hypothetical protein
MTFPQRAAFIFPLCLMLLAGCGGETRPNNTEVNSPDYRAGPGSGLGSYGNLTGGGDFVTLGGPRQPNPTQGTGALGVNAYLWRGALDTLHFMPLSSADPYSGVIITDWYSPPKTTDERFKATAYVMGRELRSDGLRVALFRQVLQDGQWVDAPISQTTVGEIENKVLARARVLREQSQASN